MAPDKTSEVSKISEQLLILEKRHPVVGRHLPSFLRTNGSNFAFAQCDREDRYLARLSITPGPIIQKQFGISLEIPVMISLHDSLQPRVLRELERLRDKPTADQDIGILVARDKAARTLVRDRQEFAYPVLVILESDIEQLHRTSSLRESLADLLRSVNHFEFSLDIRNPNQFFGRRKDIESITTLLRTGQSVGVFGLRKSGKTSLLHQVQRSLMAHGTLAPLLQLNTVTDDIDFREKITSKIAEAVYLDKGRLPTNLAIVDSRGESNSYNKETIVTRRWTADLVKIMRYSNKSLTIIIDEIDLANDEMVDDSPGMEFGARTREERRSLHRVLRELRGAVQLVTADESARKISVLAAGVAASITTSVVRYGQENQLYQFLTVHPLGPMLPADIRSMARTLGKRSGLRFHDQALTDTLYKEYGGHPHLTRMACSAVADARASMRDCPVPYPVEDADLERAFSLQGERSPHHAALQMLKGFGLWYQSEYLIVASTIAAGQLQVDDPGKVSHAVDFGICDQEGRIAMNVLRRGDGDA